MKDGAAKILEEIAVLLELKGENPFKSRAYYNAARTVEMLGEEELERLVRENKLKDIKGIGIAINEKLKELILTGGLLEILKVPGLGPRKVRALYDLLEITNLAELEYACRENRLVNLKGFGLKTQDNILEGIVFVRRIANDLLQKLKELPALDEVSLGVSIARKGWLEKKDVFNTLTRAEVEDYLRQSSGTGW